MVARDVPKVHALLVPQSNQVCQREERFPHGWLAFATGRHDGRVLSSEFYETGSHPESPASVHEDASSRVKRHQS